MFEHMEIYGYIYEGILEASYEKPTRADSNRAGHSSQNRGESASLWNIPEKGESAGKRRK